MYQGISVGLPNGEHDAADQTLDGGPRMKPDLVAPGRVHKLRNRGCVIVRRTSS